MSIISAGTSTTNALVQTGDTNGNLVFKTNDGTTALTLGTDQSATFAGSVTATGGFVGAGYTLGTPTSSSGAAYYDFSIPTSAKQIIVSFYQVSSNNAEPLINIQLGTGGTLATSGYQSSVTDIYNGGLDYANTYSSGMLVLKGTNTSNQISGNCIITLESASGYAWSSSCQLVGYGASRTQHISAGGVALSGAINILRIKSDAGSFDGGNLNVMYI